MKLHSLGICALGFSAVLCAAVTDDAWDRQLALGRGLASQGCFGEARQALEKARAQAEQFGPADARLAIAAVRGFPD